MKQTLDAVAFFEQDYVNQASYDNLRKIASLVDGLKNASRKVIYTVLEKNIYDLTKVSQLSAKAGEFADYLHGSLDGVVVTLAQDFLGTNQMPLLKKKGNFGTRAIQDASASRYIFACGSEYLKDYFLNLDRPNLQTQYFEGAKIEPRYYVPEIPILLVNGSKGVSSGFAQNILARPANEIKRILRKFVRSENPKVLDEINQIAPLIDGFHGTVVRDGEFPEVYKWLFTTDFLINKNEITLLDLPYGSDLRSYLQFLDKLEEDKKIKSYEDLTDGDNFKFVVKFDRKTDLTKIDVVKLFKLQVSVTENFTCIDQNNKILQAVAPADILQEFVKVKLEYMQKRKSKMLEDLRIKKSKDESMLWFIQNIIDGKIEFRKTTSNQLNEIFERNQLFKVDGDTQLGFGYLHRVPAGKMVQEEVQALETKIKQTKEEIQKIDGMSIYELWNETLK